MRAWINRADPDGSGKVQMVIMLMLWRGSGLYRPQKLAERVLGVLLVHGRFTWDDDKRLAFRTNDGRVLRVDRAHASAFSSFVSAALGISSGEPKIERALDVVIGMAEERRVAALREDAQECPA